MILVAFPASCYSTHATFDSDLFAVLGTPATPSYPALFCFAYPTDGLLIIESTGLLIQKQTGVIT